MELAAPRTWKVGTLVYTRRVLFSVFFWMLWGDFCITLMESVVQRLVPLQLSRLGASNALIGILTGSILSLMNWVFNPIISTMSDRHRGKLGRRMPFMLCATPPLAFFIAMLGFSANIAGWLQAEHPKVAASAIRTFAAILPDLEAVPGQAQLAIGVIGLLLVGYKFFDLFPQTVYYYLWTDVVPQSVMGTFTCLFRVCATLGGFVFHRWAMDYADTYPRAIYLGAAFLYMFAFLMLCFMVKEGDYPPPPPRHAHPLSSLGAWIKISYSSAYFWKYYFACACFMWAFVPFNTFAIIYANKVLGMTAAEFGHMFANIMLVQLPIFFAMGPIVDRIHPLRAGLLGYLLMIAAGVCAFLFVHDRTSFFWLMLAVYVAVAIFQAGSGALGPRLLPRSHYGQLCASNAMVVQSGMLVFSWLCGRIMDKAGMRFVFVWFFVFAAGGLAAIAVLYRHWRALGGDQHYQPPVI